MKKKLDFITNSSSTSWIMSLVPAAGAAASWLATSGNTSIAPSGQAYIVSGGHAVLWLQSNGLMNDQFQLTELFWQWYDEPFSQNNTNTSLLGIAGEFDSDIRDLALDRNTLENLAIVVEEGGLGTNTTNNTNLDINNNAVQQNVQEVDDSDDEQQDQVEEETEQTSDGDEDKSKPNGDNEDDDNTVKAQDSDMDNSKTNDSDGGNVQDINNTSTANPQSGIDVQHWEDRINNTIKDHVKDPTDLQGVNQTINITVNDTGDQYSIEFQNGNVHIQRGPSKNNPNINASMNQQILNDLLDGKYKTKADLLSLLNPYKWNGGDIQLDNPDVRLNFGDKENLKGDIKKLLEAFEIKVEQSTIDMLLK